jgi:hypothetical protein
MRIEELNGQVSTLLAENVALRATNIALEGQVRREKTTSCRVMAEAEAAVRPRFPTLTFSKLTSPLSFYMCVSFAPVVRFYIIFNFWFSVIYSRLLH